MSEQLALVRTLLPHIEVVEAFVDVQEPSLVTVVEQWVAHAPVVVVPVLLSTGFHTRVDIAGVVAAHPGRAVAAGALGPHDLLALALESRLEGIDVDGDVALVLAAAGSSEPQAARDVHRMAERLSMCLHVPVRVGFAAMSEPSIDMAVRDAREHGARRVVIASYVLTPGHFADLIASAGADEVTAPLAPDLRIAALIAERYAEASAQLSSRTYA